MEGKYLVTAYEAARQLGLAADGRQVRNLLVAGTLKGEQAGTGKRSTWLVYQSSIDAYAKTTRKPGPKVGRAAAAAKRLHIEPGHERGYASLATEDGADASS
jgi:hypothetical protein